MRTSLPDIDITELRYQISQIITNELLNEINNLRITGKKVATNLTLDLLAGLLPPPLSTVSSLALNALDIKQLTRNQTSWISIFMELRPSKRHP